MQDNMTMADVGSIVKVSGSRIATPFGPPRPGSTPTKMPSTSPTIISTSVFQVRSTVKPCSSRPKASIALIPEERLERSLRHDDVEGDVEGDEHGEREQQRRKQRLPQRDAADDRHETGDQQEVCAVEPEPLGEKAEQYGRHEYLHDPAQLRARHERVVLPRTGQDHADQTEQARAAEQDRKIEWEIAGLRTIGGPA